MLSGSATQGEGKRRGVSHGGGTGGAQVASAARSELVRFLHFHCVTAALVFPTKHSGG